MKRNPSLLITTFLVGTTALSLGLSAPSISKRLTASKKSQVAAKSKKKKQVQHQQLQTSQSSRVDAQTAHLRSGNARPSTAEESLGTPAPVLPASARYPQSSAKPKVAQTAITTSQSSTVQVAAVAPTNTSTATATNVAPASGLTKRFGGDLTATFTSSTTVDTASDKSMSTDLEFAPWVALSKSFKMDAYVAGNKDLRNNREWKLANSQLGIAHTPVQLIGDQVKYRAKVTLVLPTDQDAREISSYRGGLSLSNRFYFSPKAIPAFSGYYQLTGSRGFFQYETTGTGAANNPWSVGNTLLMNVDFLEKFYVQFIPRLTSRWTFQGTPSSKFEATEEIGVAIGKWSVGIGHTNADDLFKSNGQDSNFSLFDRDTSNYYLTANFSF